MTFTRDKETHNISLQVKVSGSKPPIRSQRTSKARRKSAVNTQFARYDKVEKSMGS